MMRSMFAGVSGLRSHQSMMDVVGNNIANVNTIGFKASRVTFADALSQLTRGSSGGTGEATAGVNPQQIGLGVKVAAVDQIFTQGASQLTGRATDVAIQGDGFFQVRVGGELQYTRAGSFGFDQNGFMTDSAGGVTQGWMADASGKLLTNAPPIDLQLPIGTVVNPVATTSVTLGGNLSAETIVADPAATPPIPGDAPVRTEIELIDSLGSSQHVTFEFTKTADNTWSMKAFEPDGTTEMTGSPVTLNFDPATGELSTPVTSPQFTFTPPGGADALTFTADLGIGAKSGVRQYGGPSTTTAISQDGSGTGYLRSYAISDDGIISGVFSNGRSQALGRLAVATFANPGGLIKAGDNRFRYTAASGNPIVGTPGTAGRGSLSAGTLEMSNVDLAQEFTNLIVAQRGFQANSRIITASDEILQDLVNLKR